MKARGKLSKIAESPGSASFITQKLDIISDIIKKNSIPAMLPMILKLNFLISNLIWQYGRKSQNGCKQKIF